MGKHLKGESGRSYGDGHGTGYCNPPGPKWERGQSGNPRGVSQKEKRVPKVSARDRLARDMEDLLALSRNIGGEELTLCQIMLRRIANEASGDAKLAIKFLNFVAQLRGVSEQDEGNLDDVNDDEKMIMEVAWRRYGRMIIEEEGIGELAGGKLDGE